MGSCSIFFEAQIAGNAIYVVSYLIPTKPVRTLPRIAHTQESFRIWVSRGFDL